MTNVSAVAKVVIQNKINFHYVRSPDDWTNDPSQAYDFQSLHVAAEFCREHDLKTVHIIHGQFNDAANRFDAATKTIIEVPRVRSWHEDAARSGGDALAG
jgi:hypothetical protein